MADMLELSDKDFKEAMSDKHLTKFDTHSEGYLQKERHIDQWNITENPE